MNNRSRAIGATLALSLGGLVAATSLVGADKPTPKAKTGLEVHEWGTFTSMQGIEGMTLEGLHHEEEALPAFVHNIGNTEPTRERPTKLGIAAERVTQKMETPVVYFYADKPMRAQVDVSYSRGLVSEWFPAATHRSHIRRGDRQIINLDNVSDSSIHWDVDVIPFSRPRPAGIPSVHADDPWAFARQVRAAYVRSRGTREADHYLFYRGLGAHQIAVTLVSQDDGATIVKNNTGHALPFAALLEVSPEGARFTNLGMVGSAEAATLADTPRGNTDRVVARLQTLLVDELQKTGLYTDEARAMVRTWSRQWFRSEGTRLIYIVPRPVTDNLLPMQIRPTPDKLVRTLVGRIEAVTPEVLAEVEAAITAQASRSARVRASGKKRLDRLGRFLEPHLRHVIRRGKSDTARAQAKKMLAAILADERAPANGRSRASK